MSRYARTRYVVLRSLFFYYGPRPFLTGRAIVFMGVCGCTERNSMDNKVPGQLFNWARELLLAQKGKRWGEMTHRMIQRKMYNHFSFFFFLLDDAYGIEKNWCRQTLFFFCYFNWRTSCVPCLTFVPSKQMFFYPPPPQKALKRVLLMNQHFLVAYNLKIIELPLFPRIFNRFFFSF